MSLRKQYPNEYKSYNNMKRNCYPGYSSTTTYESNNIKVCSRWLDKNGFKNFLEDLGTKPSPNHKLCRRDINKDYTPDNCMWSETQKKRKDGKVITYNNKTQTVAEWSKELEIGYTTLYERLKRWKHKKTIKEIIEQPIQEYKKKC